MPTLDALAPIDQIRACLRRCASHMRVAAAHVRTLRHVERPNVARRLARTLDARADRIGRLLDGPSCGGDLVRLRAAEDDAHELLQSCSRFLVRDGVRRILGTERFAAIDDSAVLVGELAKVAFGEAILAAQTAAPGTRRIGFDVNPLHAFTPVIAAGHEWARANVRADEADQHDLVVHLTTAMVDSAIVGEPANPVVNPTSVMTADALSAFAPEWMARSTGGLAADLDRVVDRVLPMLDGCGFDEHVLETWAHLGAASGVLRALQLDAPDPQLRADTCDATMLLRALAPDAPGTGEGARDAHNSAGSA